MATHTIDLKCGTIKLNRFTAVELGEKMTFVNVRGMWNKPCFRVEGKRNWQRLRQHYGDSLMLVIGPDDQVIDIDLTGFRRMLSDSIN